MADHFPLKLIGSRMLAPSVRHLEFSRDDGQALDFIPGQFIQVHFNYADGTPTKRSYSLATMHDHALGPGETIEIAVSYVAGGAATALCVQAALDGVKAISIFNRRDKFFANAEETVAKIRNNTRCEIHLFDLDDHDKLRAEIDSSVILTNATGVGMKPFEGQMLLPDDSFLRPDLIVSDVVYNPRKTHLLEVAEKKGCRTLNGLGMMLWQGARAFEIWTGKQMPVDYIKSILF
mgnify:CR=1 FL=1